MIAVLKNVYDYCELMVILTSKSVTLRYKLAYIGIAWAVLKPLMLVPFSPWPGALSASIPATSSTHCSP